MRGEIIPISQDTAIYHPAAERCRTRIAVHRCTAQIVVHRSALRRRGESPRIAVHRYDGSCPAPHGPAQRWREGGIIPISQDTAMYHPAAERCRTRIAVHRCTACAWGNAIAQQTWCPACRGSCPRSPPPHSGRLVGRNGAACGSDSAAQGQRARGGGARIDAAAWCRGHGS